jgi:outer membrane protein TolC
MKVNISNLKVENEKTTAVVKQQMNYLKVLMGMPLSYDFRVDAETLDVETWHATSVQQVEELNNLIELRILDKAKHSNLLEINKLKNAYLTSLAFVDSTGYTFQADKLNFGKSDLGSNRVYVGVRLSIPIFDEAQNHNKIRQAQFRVKKAEEEKKQTQQNLSTTGHKNTKKTVKHKHA